MTEYEYQKNRMLHVSELLVDLMNKLKQDKQKEYDETLNEVIINKLSVVRVLHGCNDM